MAVILVVDPDVGLRERLRIAVESVGHTSLMAATVIRGGERLREGGVDLVLVHYVEGIRLDELFARIVRLPDPPPVVLVSARPDAPSMSARYGAAEFVTVPCEAEDIIDACERVLEHRQAPSAFDDPPTAPTERWGSQA